MKLGFLDGKEKAAEAYNPLEFDPNDRNRVTVLKSDFHSEIPSSTGP